MWPLSLLAAVLNAGASAAHFAEGNTLVGSVWAFATVVWCFTTGMQAMSR